MQDNTHLNVIVAKTTSNNISSTDVERSLRTRFSDEWFVTRSADTTACGDGGRYLFVIVEKKETADTLIRRRRIVCEFCFSYLIPDVRDLVGHQRSRRLF
jgi:hypothetical protein